MGSWALFSDVLELQRLQKVPSLVLIGIDEWEKGSINKPKDFIVNVERMGFLRLTLLVEGKQLTLMELLQLCHSLKSTDPRDKVFALLGLATDGDRLIRADYTISVKELYIHTAVQILQTYENLDLHSSVSIRRTLDLPSWVPDWRTFPGSNRIYNGFEYAAHGTSKPKLRIDEESGTRTLSGFAA
jgi:hypothetical protein